MENEWYKCRLRDRIVWKEDVLATTFLDFSFKVNDNSRAKRDLSHVESVHIDSTKQKIVSILKLHFPAMTGRRNINAFVILLSRNCTKQPKYVADLDSEEITLLDCGSNLLSDIVVLQSGSQF